MKSGEKKNFEVGDIWFDDQASECYLILHYEDRFITIKWLNVYGSEMSVPDYYCNGDKFIRKISSLEKELL
jgi:hypothetical protein